MIESELLLGSPKQTLELWVSEEGDGDDESASILADVDGEVAFGDVEGELVFIVHVFLAQTRASLQDLFQPCCLRQLVRSLDRHLWGERKIALGFLILGENFGEELKVVVVKMERGCGGVFMDEMCGAGPWGPHLRFSIFKIKF